jgi:diaminopimelate decarboxylase
VVTKITHELLSTLSDRFGEAFYILDSKQFEENYKELFNSFSLIYPSSILHIHIKQIIFQNYVEL